ncbi:MAG: right-handed parallel beta-helix repeat-containing protein, partial [Planctomycetota bacterium]|nr:right-handed parallel beta-helix repeat-containing protein [Planctomycetota bacterium]
EGFTITGGTGTHLGGGDFVGGGMYNVSSSPTVTNCTFSGNTAFGGGGGGMYNDFSSPTVTNCTFDDNTASAGAGMFNFDTSSPAISHCQFINNTTSGNGAGGGMINSTNSSPTISDCTFSGNFGGGPGGGMGNGFGSSPIVTNCTFNNNTTAFSGGGIFNFTDCSPNVTNCIFTQNTATFLGGGIYNLLNSNPVVTNCSFSANSAIDAGGIYNLLNSSPMVSNCIFWDDSPAEIVDADGSISTVRYTDIQGGWTGAGSNNIDADPMFVAPGIGDYRLSSGSPSIDAGNNWGVPIDADDYDQDGNTAELFPVDLDGNPRFNADEADFDPGCGVPVVVDMGAYEYQFNPVEEVIFADLNADGVVGILDLLGVLAAWGDAKNNCLADLDIDGDVGILDLLTLLSNWG